MKLMNTGSVLEMQLCSPRFGMDILSQWQVSLVERPDLAISEPISPLGIVWQVNLPRNPYTARRMLSQHRRYQYTALQALPRAEQRLELYTSQIEQNDPGESEHYDLDENESPEPERVLHTWLVTAQQEASFTVVDNLREAGQQIVNLYRMLARLGRGNDWVNTNHAGHAMGRSRISWLGDIDTFLVRGMPPVGRFTSTTPAHLPGSSPVVDAHRVDDHRIRRAPGLQRSNSDELDHSRQAHLALHQTEYSMSTSDCPGQSPTIWDELVEKEQQAMSNGQENQTWKQSIENAITALLAALGDTSKLTVETRILPVGAEETEQDNYKGKLVARTIMEVDGDTYVGLPVTEKGEVQKELLDLHNQNLDRAMQYRSELLK